MNRFCNMNLAILFVFFIAIASSSKATNLDTVSMPFIKNEGQVAKHVSYYVQTPNALVYLNQNGEINYKFSTKNNTSVVIKETLIKAKHLVTGYGKNNSTINFIKGKEVTYKDIANYSKLGLGEVWEGIEMEVVARPGNIEKIFKVAAGKNVENIQLKLAGIKRLETSKEGQLLIQTEKETFAFTTPIAWQVTEKGKQDVKVSYNINGLTYGFKVGNYDTSKELIIDPLLSSTYIGGNQFDVVAGTRIDTNGDIILAGMTGSLNFPTTVGAISDSLSGSVDLFAMRLNADMCELLSATYIGGSGSDNANDVAFDSEGNIYYVGDSSSEDFPMPTFPYTPFQSELDVNGTIHITKLSADFSEILGATFIGGGVVDLARAIEISPTGNVYVTGFTNSNNYPYTLGAFETSGQGIIVSAFNPDLSQLLYSTRLGGGDGFGIAFDDDGSLFVAASKISISDYTTTVGAYSETPVGGLEGDNYLAHMSEDLSTLISATFIGSNSIENPYGIELFGDEVVVNTWVKSGFPMTEDPFDDTAFLGGSTAIFKMDKGLTTLNASTHIDLGSNSKMVVEANGDILVFGATGSSDFPGGKSPTVAGDNGFHGGPSDFGIVRLNSGLTQAKNAAYIGGTNQEIRAVDVQQDNFGNLILVGTTKSTDIETTQFGLDRSYNGNVDTILQKFSSDFNQLGVKSDNIFCNSFEDQTGVCSCGS